MARKLGIALVSAAVLLVGSLALTAYATWLSARIGHRPFANSPQGWMP